MTAVGDASVGSGALDHRLSLAEACDLDLLLAGALPTGSTLGRPVHGSPTSVDDAAPTSGSAGPCAAVRVRADVAEAALHARSLLLRDDEQTPLASLTSLRLRERDGDLVIMGRVRPERARESGPLPSLRADLRDPACTDRDVLLLARPPVAADEPHLSAWAEAAGPQPLLLVPEGGEHSEHVPAGVLCRLARDLSDRLDLRDAEVRVVPLFLRDPATDEYLSQMVVGRLTPVSCLCLTATAPEDGARAWGHAAERLRAGRDSGPLPGLVPPVEARLRRWRPPRAQRGLVVLLTGLSGSGKSTLARDLDAHLTLRSDRSVTLLDGDVVRRLLSSGLGYDPASRELNVLRIGWVAARVAEHGGTAICSPIAPFARTRSDVRDMVQRVGDLVLVHVSTPLQECERRDLKGLYARARAGSIPHFTGISSPYEAPVDADVSIDTTLRDRRQALQDLVDHLVDGGWIAEEAR